MNNAPLDWKDIRKSAVQFVNTYKNVKKESSYKQLFWEDFLQMYGVNVRKIGAFEYYVKKLNNHHGEIDYFWPGKVIIEHKSAGKDLEKAMDQAMDYLMGIDDSDYPRYVIVSDFRKFILMDLEDYRVDTISLAELPDNVELFGFLAGYENKRIEGQHPVNVKAAEVMGELYDLFKESNYPKEELDLLLIRIVFCMFAEDANVFDRDTFSSYIAFKSNDDGSGTGSALNAIFEVLDIPLDKRQSSMASDLQNFPYVNGGLFSKRITTPMFDREMSEILLKASRLDWKFISPAIFGSLFQSIMDPKMRRKLGAHYTSEENILKLINPLFMDDLRAEFEKIKHNKKELRKFWDKLAEIRIMDPACGCGNFLIISYRELRILEMDVLDALYEGQMIFDESHLFIDHFYGIEIGEFASMVANLSMILMDHLMNMEMLKRFGQCRDIIPLKEKANIICGNSLEIDWNSVIRPEQLTYIIGNPPFVGKKYQTMQQKADMKRIFGEKYPGLGTLDYVSAWYKKAFDYITPSIKVAFVSTNSIVQGEHVATLWKPMFEAGMNFTFGHRTFKWSNEASNNAGVSCVIIGFNKNGPKGGIIYDEDLKIQAKNITPYLTDDETIFVENRSSPLCDVSPIIYGSFALDDGNYTISEDEYKEILEKEPQAKQFLKLFIGSEEFINGINRYCVWLVDADIDELKKCPIILEKIEAVRKWRSTRTRKETRAAADTPRLFAEIRQKDTDYLAIPITSSERRTYVPIGYLNKDVIASNHIYVLPDASLYEFGIITSIIHMAWLRAVGGRLESRYNYSSKIVYNNFPWPECNEEMKSKISEKAEIILKIREKYENRTMAELYDPLMMPEDLLKAHKDLDRVVCKAYGFDANAEESAWVKKLLRMYKQLKDE